MIHFTVRFSNNNGVKLVLFEGCLSPFVRFHTILWKARKVSRHWSCPPSPFSTYYRSSEILKVLDSCHLWIWSTWFNRQWHPEFHALPAKCKAFAPRENKRGFCTLSFHTRSLFPSFAVAIVMTRVSLYSQSIKLISFLSFEVEGHTFFHTVINKVM